MPVGEDNDGLVGKGGQIGRERAVRAGAIPQISHGLRAGKSADRLGGRRGQSAPVAPQIHDPDTGLVLIGGDPLLDMGIRVRAEGGALKIAHMPFHQTGGGSWDRNGAPRQGGRVRFLSALVGHGDLGARLSLDPGGYQRGVHPQGGTAVHRHDPVAVPQPGRLGRRALQHGGDGHSICAGNGDHADPHQAGILHGGQKSLVLLCGKVLGIGVPKLFQHGGDGGLLQHLLGNGVNVGCREQGAGLLQREGLGGQRQQGSEKHTRQDTGAAASIHQKGPP